ncbi:DUF3888 domain-containing protein [Priestia endophytica]|uniref:DUF3888 domain-containing protein n=1 Tax=Priestia endophytica TaxID=135735 RepID=UPI00227E7A99|nr:DUF3888 domain-containing protein [Priestia endophytica]MCY8235305.1 DUF3888 domain-containing protein [Priestia endophytica]
MIKKTLFLIVLVFILTVPTTYSNASDLPEDLLEEELIKLLQEPILSVVGTGWFSGNEKILEIKQAKKNKDVFFITVQVVTFEGPHNPPYMEEVITFRIKGNKVNPIDYFNRVIPESEWHKFEIP